MLNLSTQAVRVGNPSLAHFMVSNRRPCSAHACYAAFLARPFQTSLRRCFTVAGCSGWTTQPHSQTFEIMRIKRTFSLAVFAPCVPHR